jgi:signal transduction histidine kinase
VTLMRDTDRVERPRALRDRLVTAALAVRPPAFDVVIVALVLAVSVVHENWETSGLTSTVVMFDAALVLPLLWRRRRPAVVFLVIAAVAFVQWLADVQATADVAVLIALYAVGAYERQRLAIAASAVIAQLGVVLAAARWAPQGSEVTSGILLTGTAAAAWILGVYLRTRRAYINSVIERAATAEHERDQQALIATVTERARISREMHDIVAHSLSVIIALSDGAVALAIRDPQQARTAMQQSSDLGRQALGDVRRLLGALNNDDETGQADLVPQPGIAQLDALVRQVRSAGLAVDLVIVGQAPELGPGAGLTLYRMVQEALTNVLKHAPSAKKAVVTLRYGSDCVDIEVENDDPHPVTHTPATPLPAAAARGGHGLTGMRARAATFDGTVNAGRRTDGGWRLTSRLRLEEQHPQ